MAQVGVIGLGNIGGAVAANVVKAGHATTVFDADPTRVAAVAGARAATSVAEVAAASEITITSLPTPAIVSAVADEWATAAAPGSILLDLSTTLPSSNAEIATRLRASGHHFVEAPLTGGAIGAQNASLVFMVAGDDDAVARCEPLLAELGRATFRMGAIGTGTTMKLVNSLLAFTCTLASLEALSIATAAGIDLRTAVDVIRTGGASNFFVDRAVEGIGARGKEPQFALGLAAKDAGLIEEVAAAHGVPAPVAAAVAEVLADAVARGMGEQDWTELPTLAEARAGVTFDLRPPTAD
jgi:3-hydroxyisobutyrate dehydrogenase-like beta-hydroxyacid dehydrogenase